MNNGVVNLGPFAYLTKVHYDHNICTLCTSTQDTRVKQNKSIIFLGIGLSWNMNGSLRSLK